MKPINVIIKQLALFADILSKKEKYKVPLTASCKTLNSETRRIDAEKPEIREHGKAKLTEIKGELISESHSNH